MIRTVLIAATLFATPAFADVTVTAPWARASILASRPGAVYLTLQGDSADILLTVSTPMANAALIHSVETGEDGIARMGALETLPLAAGAVVTMVPGDMHIMLMDLTEKLVEGETFPLHLTFETGGEVTIDVPILGIASKGPVEAMQ
jgi:copper(I)-binding protein